MREDEIPEDKPRVTYTEPEDHRGRPDHGRHDLERLSRWIEQLSNGVSLMESSRRWRLGRALSNLRRKALRRPTEPPLPENIQRVRHEFGEWRKAHRQQVHESPKESEQPASKPSGPHPPKRREPQPGAGEHVLEALRIAPPVTILIPIHNAREDLQRCLESVARNTTAPAELLLIDDASTDTDMPALLSEYEVLDNVRMLKNEHNLGFVGTVNRGLSESRGDVVLLNSDVEVTPRWLENLRLAAYRNPRTATATPISDNAGAFSMPETGKQNDTPAALDRDSVGRLVMQESEQVYPQTPTGNGFCMYLKRAAIEDVGLFDAESFPRGYGEENDYCMRAKKRGWNHVVDDATFMFHRRQASFGEERQRIIEGARAKLDELHPDYRLQARAFLTSEDLKKVGENISAAFRQAELSDTRPRILFVIQGSPNAANFRSESLMAAISDRYTPYLLASSAGRLRLYEYTREGLSLLEERELRGKIGVTEYERPDYREIVFDMMIGYRFELVHVWHLLGHTFDLPQVAARLGLPVLLYFPDFYLSCPTVHLIDDHGQHCGGICTPGQGQCALPTPRLQQLPVLKHAYLGTWRDQVEKMFANVDAFVAPSNATKDVYLRSMPVLREKPFTKMEPGRNLGQERLASPPKSRAEGEPVRILALGNVTRHKGAGFIRALKQCDEAGLLEFHLLGRVDEEFRGLGVEHGPYEGSELMQRVREISPSFIGIFSIWPETYCHTLTEAWAAGLPVLASDIGTLRERVLDHGGGWLLDLEDPAASYRRILDLASDHEEYERELGRADLNGIPSVGQMADEYDELYASLLQARKGLAR